MKLTPYSVYWMDRSWSYTTIHVPLPYSMLKKWFPERPCNCYLCRSIRSLVDRQKLMFDLIPAKSKIMTPKTPDCDHCCHFSKTTYLKFPINICLASIESIRSSKRIGICGAYRWDGSEVKMLTDPNTWPLVSMGTGTTVKLERKHDR